MATSSPTANSKPSDIVRNIDTTKPRVSSNHPITGMPTTAAGSKTLKALIKYEYSVVLRFVIAGPSCDEIVPTKKLAQSVEMLKKKSKWRNVVV